MLSFLFCRFLGVGAMLVGGVFALISLRHALWKGVEAGIKVRNSRKDGRAKLVNTVIIETESMCIFYIASIFVEVVTWCSCDSAM